ncbi:hypothetical protein BV20DRAFT_728025 [Pilatotrama ljubarskyi]|nr:hypothetical protein BV20DRAFT_728025 [Pilatotrama ljubarskyi]
MDREELKQLPRSELQKLAKTHGVKANIKSEAIIAQLLERFTDGAPAHSDAAKIDHSDAGPTKPSVEKKDAPAPPQEKRARKLVAMKKQPKQMVRPQSPVNEPQSREAAPVARRSPRKASRAHPQQQTGVVEGPSTPREADKSISSASRAPYVVVPPLSALRTGTRPRAQSLEPPRSSPRTRSHTGNTETSLHEFPSGLGPFYSISTGIPRELRNLPEERGRPAPLQILNQAIQRIIHGSPHTANGPPSPPQANAGAADDSDMVMDGDTTYTGPPILPILPSQVPSNATNIWTPSTPPRSRGPPPPPVDPMEEDVENILPEEPRASENQVKAVVAKIADISRVHKVRMRTLNEYGDRVVRLSHTADNLRTLVRQERSHRVRMQNYLAYWNAIEPKWKEDEIWDRARPTRIDDDGYEIEIMSDEEDEVRKQHPLPSGAQPTEILMRRVAHRREEVDEDVRLSERLELTAERQLPGTKKRRRPTPAKELELGTRPAKRARRPENDGAATDVAAPRPLPDIAEDDE